MESWGRVRRPNFFLVGAPKCGTTAMHAYLAGHPDIFMAVKEPHFFGDEWKLSESSYRNLFRGARSQRIVGEASVHYLASPTAPAQIKAFAPDAKILVMLRDPTEVIERLHEELVFQGLEPITDLRAALAAEPARRAATPPGQTSPLLYREQVAFDEQIARYVAAFGPDRVHVVDYESFRADNLGELRNVLAFLAVDPSYAPAPQLVNKRKIVSRPWLHRLVLDHPAWTRWLARRALPDTVRRRLWKTLMWASSRPGQVSRLLVVTGYWPTEDMPSAGIFVQRRLRGIDATVVGPRTYAEAMPLRYLKLLWRALTVRGRFDGVEAHSFFPAGLIGLLAARIRRVPLVVYAHGSDVRVTAQENAVYRALSRYLARHADAVVTNSEATAEHVRRLGREPEIIPPGVDLDAFRPSPRPAERRVLYLGGKRPEKGYDVAVGIADTLAGQRLQEIAPNDVPVLISAHDVVLMPSRSEGFGLAAAEAIASGRWVVAADVDGLRSVVTNGVNGTLVSDGDYERAIAAVPDYDPVAIAKTAERFSLREHQRRMGGVWDRILTRPSRSA